MTRHLPGLAATCLMMLFVGLTLWGYAKELDHAIAGPPISPQVTHQQAIITAYHNRLGVPQVSHSLATLLTSHPIKRLAFDLLLSLKPQETYLTAYLYHAPLGPVRGFVEGANYYFGVPLAQVTHGELLLLCDKAVMGSPIKTDPEHTLQRRDALLADLHKRGILSDDIYLAECNHALSLAADHRPIY